MKRVLDAEDEQAIREFIVINLKSGGYKVQQAENGRQALQIFDDCGGDFDIALLDIMMPEMDGLELCKKLRERSQQLGIIMLSARTQEMDKVTGLLVGADDYITKPFSPSELMARVNSVYRRVDMNRDTVGSSRSEIQLGDFTLNLRNRTLLKGDVPIELTQVEFQIMECFFKNPNAALSRTEILNKVWGSSYFGEEKIVDVNIRRLRVKLEENPSDPKHLITIWGMGYKWIV